MYNIYDNFAKAYGADITSSIKFVFSKEVLKLSPDPLINQIN